MNIKDKIYVLFTTLFCVIIITGNLIFQKFLLLDCYFYKFEISAGVLLYPFTFLITDLITEFFGKEKANYTIKISFISSLMVMLLINIANALPAVSWSIIDDDTFSRVFKTYNMAFLISICANYVAQATDIWIFIFLKNWTNSKHLWLRNNVSTIIAQFIDTLCVLLLLCVFNIIPWVNFSNLLFDSYLFKVICALLDTPFCYLGHSIIRKLLGDTTPQSKIS